MPIVTTEGFRPADPVAFRDLEEAGSAEALDLPNDADAETLRDHFATLRLIRIPFPKADDGRGFSLARRLRDLGYRGRLRARGHVISDQFRHALACGFDEVEISEDHAARQPEAHWRARSAPSYREKLRGR